MSEEYWGDDGKIIRMRENHVVWRNAQWVITGDGFLSARWCGYHIEPGSLNCAGDHKWHAHMARKTWIDMIAFNQAFREAVRRNGVDLSDEQITAWENAANQYLEGSDRSPRYDNNTDEHYGHWS